MHDESIDALPKIERENAEMKNVRRHNTSESSSCR